MKLPNKLTLSGLMACALVGALALPAHAGQGEHHAKHAKKEYKMDKKAGGPTVGQKAPSFTLTNSDGKNVSLSDYEGKLVVLEWTNHECPFVKKHYSSNNMQNLQKKYTEQAVVWLSIVSSAPGNQGHIDGSKAKMLTKERSASPSQVLFDPSGNVGKQYHAKTTPHMYIVNTDGTLLYNGAIDSIKSADTADIAKADNYVDVALSEIMAGKEVSQPITRPYGCSVKYKS